MAIQEIFDFPDVSSDFLADAVALNRLWWQIKANVKNSPFVLDGISPMTLDAMLDRAEEICNTDEDRGELLVNFAETVFELEGRIISARNKLEAAKG